MKQRTQKLKNGSMQITEMPVYDLRPGVILEQNYYSLISAETERGSDKPVRKDYIDKAKERPKKSSDLLRHIANTGANRKFNLRLSL